VQAMRAANGRAVDRRWIAQRLQDGGWPLLFGDRELLKVLKLPTDKGQLRKLYTRRVRRALNWERRPSEVVVVADQRKEALYRLASDDDDQIPREELRGVLERLLPSEDAFATPLQGALFKRLGVSLVSLRVWRDSAPDDTTHAYPQEVAIDCVARLLGLDWQGRVLEMPEWRLELPPPQAFPQVEWGAGGDVVLRTRRNVEEGRVAAADRQLLAEAALQKLLAEHLPDEPSTGCAGLLLLGLYRSNVTPPRARPLLAEQLWQLAAEELHATPRQVRALFDRMAATAAAVGLELLAVPEMIIVRHVEVPAAAAAVAEKSEMELYRLAHRGGGTRRHPHYYRARSDQPVRAVSDCGNRKRSTTIFFFRVRAPCPLDLPPQCLQGPLNVPAGKEGARFAWPLGGEALRVALEGEGEMPPGAKLCLRDWSGDGGALVLGEGFLMGEVWLYADSPLEGHFTVSLKLGATLLGRAELLLLRGSQKPPDKESELDETLPWSPASLQRRMRKAPSVVPAPESSPTAASTPVAEPAPVADACVAASVAPFVRAVAAWMAVAGHRPELLGRLRVDDLVAVAYAVQQRMRVECAEVAADIRDRAQLPKEDDDEDDEEEEDSLDELL
jgi:hypothetical protein